MVGISPDSLTSAEQGRRLLLEPISPHLVPDNDGTVAFIPIALSRDTEGSAIVVEAGRCELADVTFSNAAERLADLDLEGLLQNPAAPSTEALEDLERTKVSTPTAHTQSRKTAPSRSPRQASRQSLGSILEEETSQSPWLVNGSIPDLRSDIDDNDTQHGSSFSDNGSPSVTTSSQSGSPFGHPIIQRMPAEVAVHVQEKNAILKVLVLQDPLLSTLRSLEFNELSVYLHLVDKIRTELGGDGVVLTQDAPQESSPAQSGSQSSAGYRKKVQQAIEELTTILPSQAIVKLQPYPAYGLVEAVDAHLGATPILDGM